MDNEMKSMLIATLTEMCACLPRVPKQTLRSAVETTGGSAYRIIECVPVEDCQ
jgi:hypothetical protein